MKSKSEAGARVLGRGTENKLTKGLSLPERLDFVKLCQQCALPFNVQSKLITAIASGKIQSFDQMITLVEGILGEGVEQYQKDVDTRFSIWKILSLPELERLTITQWELYTQCLSLCHMYPFWSTDILTEVSGWQTSWYRFCGLPDLSST